MAVKSKAVIGAFYDRAPRFSYWTGCSTGGRQGLMAAQRYPEDFDGIIAGAPANNQTQLCAWRIAVEARILQEPESVVPRTKLALVNRAVLAACDALDGVTDGLLTDPHQCRSDPASLLCRGVDMAHCGGGPGPNQVNWMAAMERWRESGIAPNRLLASRVSDNRVNMTRPVCPYPQVAQYTGVGSTNDAANFVCKER